MAGSLDILKAQPLDRDGPFKIALILQHIAEFYEMDEAVDWYEKSLEYDPDNREIYLKIIRTHAHQGLKSDDFKEWLEKCLTKFPDDLDFLLLAIKDALHKKAFKKAAQFAERLLKIDPVNTYAKQTLFRCYLAHTRKLLTSKKFHLIEAELKRAQALTLGKRYQGLADLMQGFFVYSSDDPKQGVLLISEALNKLDDSSVNRRFFAAMETSLLKLSTSPLLDALPSVPKKYVLSEPELTRLVELVQHYVEEDDAKYSNIHRALETVKAPLKSAIKE